MEDDEIKKSNSIPTTEGIIADLVYNTPHTINGSDILVLGYGNVGKLLTEKLIALDARVAVGVNTSSDFNTLMKDKIDVFYTNNQTDFSNNLVKANIVVNTVPSLLLDKNYLDVVNHNTYILDISSYPYGIDFDYAKNKYLKCKLFSGIPGVVAPKTSGLILSKKIKHVIGGE
jgi:dipicolinate synthase subunit A